MEKQKKKIKICPECYNKSFLIQINEYEYGSDLTFICKFCGILFENQNDILEREWEIKSVVISKNKRKVLGIQEL